MMARSNRGARGERQKKASPRRLRTLRLMPLLLATFAAALVAQSRPQVDPARFKWVLFVDCFMFPFDNTALAARNGDEAVYMPLQTKLRRQYEQQVGLQTLPATFADYLSFVSRSLEASQKRGGVAVKFEA